MIDTILDGRRGLFVSSANEHSSAAGFASAFRAAGAELAVTYASEHSSSTPRQSAFVNAALFLPRDIEGQGQAELVVREAVHGALFQQHPQVHYRIASRLASETGPPEARGPACR